MLTTKSKKYVNNFNFLFCVIIGFLLITCAGATTIADNFSVNTLFSQGASSSLIGTYSGGTWYLDYNGNYTWDGTPTDGVAGFGAVGDVYVVGDWNGDGKDEIGVFRNGVWYLDYNGNGFWDGTPTDVLASFGSAGYTPVVGDWNGDGNS